MTTIYTYNGQVIREATTGKWFIEPTYVPPVPTDEVQIGNQIWKSKNLAVDDGQGGIYTYTVNYGQGDVTEYYYTWDAAVRVANSISGWHLPDMFEFSTLASSVGGISTAGTKLKSTYGWTTGNGTDEYDFTALPSGAVWYDSTQQSLYSVGTYACFWTSTKFGQTTQAYAVELDTSATFMLSRITYTSNTAGTVRLVKDSQ